MSNSSNLPDIRRPDAHRVLVSDWDVGTPERQRATAEAFVAAWQRGLWPRGLLSTNLFASMDGETVLNYAQWTSDETCEEFVRTDRRSLIEKIDRAVSGIKRHEPAYYRLYRSLVRDDPPTPGCVVIVSVEFESADELRQRRWIDTVFEALESETELHPGGISGHFHLSTDGTRVLNYAEWTDEHAHCEALERSGQGAIGRGPKWLEVKNFPGVISSGFKRYYLLRSLSNSGSDRAPSAARA